MGAQAGLSCAAAEPPLLLVTATGGARGAEALAAALAVCAADEGHAALLVEVGSAARRRRPTLLASPAARSCEAELGRSGLAAAARGLLCHLAPGEGAEGLERGAEAVARLRDCAACVIQVEAALWQQALEHPRLRPRAALIRAELPRDSALAALAVRDLTARGLGVRVAARPLGWAGGRRALAGVRIGVAEEARVRRWTDALLGGKAWDRPRSKRPTNEDGQPSRRCE
jgi:hypothetical protein